MSEALDDLDVASRMLDTLPRAMAMVRAQFRVKPKTRLSLAQYRALGRLRRRPRTNAELAESLGVSLPAVTRMVNGLAKQKFVSRTPSKEDRRRVAISCTKTGLAAYDGVRAELGRRLAQAVCLLNDDDKRLLVAGLAVLRALAGDADA